MPSERGRFCGGTSLRTARQGIPMFCMFCQSDDSGEWQKDGADEAVMQSEAMNDNISNRESKGRRAQAETERESLTESEDGARREGGLRTRISRLCDM
jgi:hypothetical protein